MIVEAGVDTFLFGSRSKFDELFHIVATELKEKYSHIQRIAYLCKHESGCFAGEGIVVKNRHILYLLVISLLYYYKILVIWCKFSMNGGKNCIFWSYYYAKGGLTVKIIM